MQGGFRNPIVHTTNLIGEVQSNQIADGAIIEAKLANLAVAAGKLQDQAVNNSKLADNSVSTIKIQDASIVTAKIGLLAVGSAQIANLAVTNAKIANLAVTDAKINTLSATKITTGTLDTGDITLRTRLVTDSGVWLGEPVDGGQTDWSGISLVRNQGALATNTALMKDPTGRVIFRVNSGIGNSIDFDSDTGELNITGLITGSRFRTAASGKRLEIQGDLSDDFIRFFDSAGVEKIQLGYSATLDDFLIDLGNGCGMHWFSEGKIFLGNNFSGATGTIELSSGNRIFLNSDTNVDLDAPKVVITQGSLDTGSGSQGDALRFKIHGVEKMLLFNDQTIFRRGSAAAPSISFDQDGDSGMYLVQANFIGLATAGTQKVQIGTSIAIVTPGTTGSAANLYAGGPGLANILRSTSVLKYKPGWKPTKRLAEIDLPTPITWLDENDQRRIGFGAEHIWDAVPEAYEHENYDLRSVVAIMSEKIKRLEAACLK